MSNIENNDDLRELLANKNHKLTNKYTKLLGTIAVAVWLLAAGAWYGHHSATSSANSLTTSNINSLRAAFGGSSASGSRNGLAGGGLSGFGGGGFGGVRVTGTISKVNGSEVTVKLDDPTQSASLKNGDSARLTDTGASGAPAGGAPAMPAPAATGKPSANAKSGTSSTSGSKSSATTKPSVGGSGSSASGSGQRRGRFSDPAVQACLTKEGIKMTAGTRPDFQDPKVQAAFAKCIPGFGQGFGGGARPSGAPSAPSN